MTIRELINKIGIYQWDNLSVRVYNSYYEKGGSCNEKERVATITCNDNADLEMYGDMEVDYFYFDNDYMDSLNIYTYIEKGE